MVRHSSADTTVGTAHGMKIAARTMPRPRNRLLSATARDSPMTVSMATDTTVKPTVCTSAGRNWSLVNSSL